MSISTLCLFPFWSYLQKKKHVYKSDATFLPYNRMILVLLGTVHLRWPNTSSISLLLVCPCLTGLYMLIVTAIRRRHNIWFFFLWRSRNTQYSTETYEVEHSCLIHLTLEQRRSWTHQNARMSQSDPYMYFFVYFTG